MNDSINILICLYVIFSLHLLSATYIFHSEYSLYRFADSFFYAPMLERFLPDYIIIFLPLLLCLISTVIIYKIAVKNNITYPVLSTIAVMSFPSIFNAFIVGYIDTPSLIFLGIIIFWYSTTHKGKKKYFFMGLSFLILSLWSKGILLFYLLLFAYLVVLLIKENLDRILVSTVMSITILILFDFILNVSQLKLLGVSEYTNVKFIGYYLIAVIFLCSLVKRYFGFNEIFASILLPLSFMYNRITLFLSAFLILSKNIKSKHLKIAIIILNIFSLSISFFFLLPMHTDDLKKATDFNGEIINFWDSGHAINYYSSMKPCCIAQPDGRVYLLFDGYFKDVNESKKYLDKVSEGQEYYVLVEKRYEWLKMPENFTKSVNNLYNYSFENKEIPGFIQVYNSSNYVTLKRVGN